MYGLFVCKQIELIEMPQYSGDITICGGGGTTTGAPHKTLFLRALSISGTSKLLIYLRIYKICPSPSHDILITKTQYVLYGIILNISDN